MFAVAVFVTAAFFTSYYVFQILPEQLSIFVSAKEDILVIE